MYSHYSARISFWRQKRSLSKKFVQLHERLLKCKLNINITSDTKVNIHIVNAVQYNLAAV